MDYIVKKLVAKQLKAKGNKRKPKKGGAGARLSARSSGGAVQEPNNPLVGFGKKKKRGSAMTSGNAGASRQRSRGCRDAPASRMKAVKRGGALNPIRPMSIGNSISGTAF